MTTMQQCRAGGGTGMSCNQFVGGDQSAQQLALRKLSSKTILNVSIQINHNLNLIKPKAKKCKSWDTIFECFVGTVGTIAVSFFFLPEPQKHDAAPYPW
jgi:hypothetical protein